MMSAHHDVRTHPNVLVGHDDWLFLENDTNQMMKQITGTIQLPEDFQDKWRDLFEYRAKMLAELTGCYFYAVVPNKPCVYPQFLPERIKVASRRPVHDVLDAAVGQVRHRYFLSDVQATSLKHQTFPKGDTHWNHRGALSAVNAMMQELSLPTIEPGELEFQVIDTPGDLARKLDQSTSLEIARFLKPTYRVVEDNKINNVGRRVILENVDSSLPSLVLFRDSFASAQMNMLASRFSRIVALWQPNIDYNIVERENPDFVISQQVERFLLHCPDDLTGFTNAEYEAEKRRR